MTAMEKFPSLERERERTNAGQPSQAAHLMKTPDYNHTAEVIFAFPSLQLHLKSEHWQSGMVPLLTGPLIHDHIAFIYLYFSNVQ